jgi:para-nitrobenzyl esterase
MTMIRIAIAFFATLAATAVSAQTVRVKVDGGLIAGQAGASADIFRNIPYAAAPVGDLRWAAPRAAKAWRGERDATKNGPSCPQPMLPNDLPNSGGANGPTSEDCLQLNVFAPSGLSGQRAAAKAPVMVWIHGGGHRTGAGWVYDGTNFARDGVVVVSINYRLGALGNFAHPALTKGGQASGNFGLMDQIAALKWVKRNIKAFGGDPANVTVFGESAGGMSTLALLATPAARGLYHKAIVQSGGGWFRPANLADKEREGVAALAQLGVSDRTKARDLRTLPVDKIAGMNGDYGPFTDGVLVRQTPSQALVDGGFDDVPLIIGANSGEDSLMGPGPLPPRALADVTPALRVVYSREAAKGDEAVARAAFGDRTMVGPARWVAAQAFNGRPAWLYHFSYVGARFRPMGVTRAAHAAEIQYVWEYWGRRTPMSLVSDEDKAMAGLMHACWVAFAKTGAPACGPTAWPAYDPRDDQLMEFGEVSGLRGQFRKSQLDVQEAAVLPTLALGRQ